MSSSTPSGGAIRDGAREADGAPDGARAAGGPAPDGDRPLEGRTALVTGAGRGLGRVITRGLVGAGARVLAVGRDESALGELASSADGEVVPRPYDLADVEGIDGWAAALGDVDVLVNAAAVMSERRSKTLEVSLGAWRAVRDVDLDAPFALVRALVPGMVGRRWGRVVNVSACLGRMSGPGTAGGLAPYRMAKAGLNAMTRNLAHELGLGSRGVLVDATCPGHCRTDMGGPDAPRSPEEGADTAIWLACRSASRSDPPPTGRLWEDRAEVHW